MQFFSFILLIIFSIAAIAESWLLDCGTNEKKTNDCLSCMDMPKGYKSTKDITNDDRNKACELYGRFCL